MWHVEKDHRISYLICIKLNKTRAVWQEVLVFFLELLLTSCALPVWEQLCFVLRSLHWSVRFVNISHGNSGNESVRVQQACCAKPSSSKATQVFNMAPTWIFISTMQQDNKPEKTSKSSNVKWKWTSKIFQESKHRSRLPYTCMLHDRTIFQFNYNSTCSCSKLFVSTPSLAAVCELQKLGHHQKCSHCLKWWHDVWSHPHSAWWPCRPSSSRNGLVIWLRIIKHRWWRRRCKRKQSICHGLNCVDQSGVWWGPINQDLNGFFFNAFLTAVRGKAIAMKKVGDASTTVHLNPANLKLPRSDILHALVTQDVRLTIWNKTGLESFTCRRECGKLCIKFTTSFILSLRAVWLWASPGRPGLEWAIQLIRYGTLGVNIKLQQWAAQLWRDGCSNEGSQNATYHWHSPSVSCQIVK